MAILRCVDSKGQSFDVFPGQRHAGFTERSVYMFSVQATEVRLLIDEVALATVSSADGYAWQWQPGFYAGEVSAELIDSTGRLLADYRLDVSPRPDKLGRDAFQHMLDELFEFDPRLVLGTEAAQARIGVAGSIRDAHLEYARLRRHGARLVEAMKAVAQRPLLRLRHDRRRVRQHEVRRLDRRSLHRAIRDPAALGLLGISASGAFAGSATFDVARSREEIDCPANRTMLATLRAVMRRSRQVMQALEELARNEEPSETRTALAPRMARRRQHLESLFQSLSRLERAPPFSQIARAEVSAAGLNAVSAHPAYARAFRYGWYVLRPGVRGDLEDETSWISPTWEIYERWCFIKCVQALKDVFPGASWKRTYPTSRDDCIQFRTLCQDMEITVWLQVRCPAWDTAAGSNFRSVSGQRYPDIVVTVESPDFNSFIILDAKYRTARLDVLDAMSTAHVYKDCLRWKGMRPSASLLFVPCGGGADWLEQRDFRQSHGVGVVVLGGDGDVPTVAALLKEFLVPPS